MTTHACQRILIVRPSALGDVCRTAPLLASLRMAFPEAEIAWVVQDDFAGAIEAHPALSDFIAFPRSRFGGWWTHPGRALEVRQWLGDLRRRRFDVVIDAQGLGRSGLITRATGAPLRVGWRDARECAWLAYNRRVPDAREPWPAHAVDQMLALLRPLGIQPQADMRLYVAATHKQWWQRTLTQAGAAAGSSYAVLAPGSRWASKRWPIERFASLVHPLMDRGFERVVVIGASSERSQVQPLLSEFAAEHSRVIDLVGGTNIGQTMAVIEHAGIVVANDSAPLHMAVAFDRPCIALYGPTDPQRVGPYRRGECVVRAYQESSGDPPNFKDSRLGDSLMRLISTAMVLQAIDRVLSLWPQRQRFPRCEFSRATPVIARMDEPAAITTGRSLNAEAAT